MENNDRILVSWRFGIWKTYFLNKYFEDKKEKYDVYHLFPVNYQISSSEDIIELIKYDIIVELFKKYKLQKKEFDIKELVKKENVRQFVKEKGLDVAKNLLSYIPKLGQPLSKTIELTESYKKICKENQERNDPIVWLEDHKNSIVTDFVTEHIENQIKENKGEKKSVLIIDDLERIDPEHIFRILNVFSVFIDSDNNEYWNKFWFDKIILVSDYNNLKSIFHHKYWEKTDANWYFDKFYSSEIFEFNNKKILDAIWSIIRELECKNETLKTFTENWSLHILINDMLEHALKNNKLNLRMLLKWTKIELSWFEGEVAWHTNREKFCYVFVIAIKVLIWIFGQKEWLKEVLKCDKYLLIDKKYENKIKDILNTLYISKQDIEEDIWYSINFWEYEEYKKNEEDKINLTKQIEIDELPVKVDESPDNSVLKIYFDIILQFVDNI